MRDKSIDGRKPDRKPDKNPRPAKPRTLMGGHDPREMGRRGGLARAASLSPAEKSAIGANAQLARTLKHQAQLQSLVTPAIKALKVALKTAHSDPSALIRIVTAILDRTGHGPKSSIEVDGSLTHSGELIHRTQCLDVDRLPLIVKLMMAAAIESDWQPSEELAAKIKAELPMLQCKVESSKPDRKAITDGSRPNGSHINAAVVNGSIIDRAVAAIGDQHQHRDQDQEQDQEQEQDDAN